MEITQIYRIAEVHGTRAINAPYKFKLENMFWAKYDEQNEIVLDKDACEQHHITPSLDLVGRYICCTLTPRVLKKDNEYNGHGIVLCDMQDIQPEDLLINNIRRNEEWLVYYPEGSPDDTLMQNITYSISLSSYNECGGSRFAPSPCPWYNLTISLREEQFQECTRFQRGTVLTVHLNLLPEDIGTLLEKTEPEEEPN